MFVYPLCNAQFLLIRGESEGAIRCRRQTVLVIGNEDDDLAVEHLADMFHGDLAQSFRSPLADQVSAQVIQGSGPALPQPRCFRLIADPEREPADDEGNDEHHDKREEISDIADREAVVGRDEEKIEGSDAQDRGEEGRPRAGPACGEHDAEQVHHGQVQPFEIREHELMQCRCRAIRSEDSRAILACATCEAHASTAGADAVRQRLR